MGAEVELNGGRFVGRPVARREDERILRGATRSLSMMRKGDEAATATPDAAEGAPVVAIFPD